MMGFGGLGRSTGVLVLRAAARTRRGRVGLALTGIVVGIAVFGPLVAPYSSTALRSVPFSGPSSGALLGTDAIGRDALSRVLDGGRVILLVAFAATLLGVSVGAALGLVAGYRKGFVDEVVMRTLDVALAFPQILLALLLVSILGAKLWLVCLAVALIFVPQVARVVRAATLRSVEEDFVRYAEGLGVPARRIIRREVLPSVVGPLMVEAGLRLTFAVSLVASLSFLGFGLQPPAADWGLMITENRIGIPQNPWPIVVPVLLIALLTIGVNTFTDAVARAAYGSDVVALPGTAVAPIGSTPAGDGTALEAVS